MEVVYNNTNQNSCKTQNLTLTVILFLGLILAQSLTLNRCYYINSWG